jgi:hypothetical protein
MTTIVNPRVVIEVHSESTESYDRGAKFRFYQQVPSVDEYVLVSQNQPLGGDLSAAAGRHVALPVVSRARGDVGTSFIEDQFALGRCLYWR